MGKSRFKTPLKLLREKSGPPIPESEDNKYIKERGNRIETIVRELAETRFGFKLPACNAMSTRFPFIRASLDGFCAEKECLVEIKLLSSQSKEKFNPSTEGYQKFLALQKNNTVPEDYYPQIQHQLYVLGLEWCFLIGCAELRGQAITQDDLVYGVVERDNDYIKKLVAKECDFWYSLDCRYENELE